MSRPNPFADPSNPFEDETIKAGISSEEVYEEDDLQQTPRMAQQPASGGRTDDTANRFAELNRREAELADRERNLGVREEQVRNYGKNNWPPVFPLIFMDINSEIPAESRTVVMTLYRLWLLLVAVLIANLVGCILLLVSGQADGAKDMGAAILYLPVITVTSFLLWFRPIYNAYMKEHALFYYLFFLFGGFHCAFSVYMLIGIPSTGSAGIINTIHAFATGSIVTGVFGVIATVGWALQTAGIIFEYRRIWSHHNERGHSFEQAKNEMATHGFKAYFSRGSQV